MKSLKFLSTSAFADGIINEVDAPNIKSITVDQYEYSDKTATFAVGAKNF